VNKKEAVKLISQALSNLREDYPYKTETWLAFSFLDICRLANTGYELIAQAPDKPNGIVTKFWDNRPFVRIDPTKVDSEPSSHVGEIKASYKNLCKVFGKHDKWHDTYKQDASWHIEFQDGTFATIGNYKDGHNYLGSKGSNLVDIKRWDVWGSKKSLELIRSSLKKDTPK